MAHDPEKWEPVFGKDHALVIREAEVSDFVLCEKAGAVMTITLNRPEQGNAVSNAMGGEIIRMLDDAGDAKLIVLRGAGKDFCRGRDIASLKAAGPLKTVVEFRAGNATPALALFGAFRRVPQPVLAVVQGKALGLGCGLAGVADITIAVKVTGIGNIP